MAVSFRGNSIHAPSRDLSVLPSRGWGWLAVVLARRLSWRGSRFVQLTAQLSQRGSHTVTPATYVPIPLRGIPGTYTPRGKEWGRPGKRRHSRNPKPHCPPAINRPLRPIPEWRTHCLRMLWLLSRDRDATDCSVAFADSPYCWLISRRVRPHATYETRRVQFLSKNIVRKHISEKY